ncbi:MAG: hypothetical protein KAJ19_08410, partial [Gammaproteobacteria bacterium]|nr:hypothetical protein [Gammaproteobacteria bacterium]
MFEEQMNTIYIIGGGPSLIGFDWALLAGKSCIAVNKAYQVIDADYIYFSDLRFWLAHQKELRDTRATKITGAKVEDSCLINFTFTGMKGLETKPNQIRSGNNSGYAAMNVAYHLGATRIILLGFDMKFKNDKSHWHEGHEVENMERTYNKMLPYFET